MLATNYAGDVGPGDAREEDGEVVDVGDGVSGAHEAVDLEGAVHIKAVAAPQHRWRIPRHGTGYTLNFTIYNQIFFLL